ncbi:glycosyltransferase family 4 protein, partial [Aquipuribacter hungaricus]
MRAPGDEGPDRLRVAVTVEQSWQPVPGGTASSTNALLAELARRDDLRVWGVAAAHRRPAPGPWQPPVPVHHLPLPRLALYRTWPSLRWPAVTAGRGPRPDVVHATSPAVPPSAVPLVATVHDLAFLERPDLYTPRGVRFLTRGTTLAREQAAAVVVPSRAVLEECLVAGFDTGRLSVVPHGVSVPDVAPSQVADLRRRLDLPGEYVLWCGTHEPRKNLATLLRAFELLVADGRDLHLLLVGPQGWGPLAVPAAPVAARVRTAGFLDPADLHAAYAGAAVMAYPSLREGFGMPVLEAMAHGVPVVTTRGSAMAEFATGAGVLVDPTDPAAVAAGVDAALSDAAALGAQGLRTAAGMTWA